MRRFVKISLVGVLAVAAVFICLLSASVYTYNALTAETVIAEVSFTRVSDQQHLAHLRTGDRCEEVVLPVYGDQWRIDAQFLKWKYWATLLGLDSQYRLDRFEGRYSGITDQNTKPALAHDLGTETAVDITAVSEALGPLNFLTDATYGSSTYHDIDTARVFYVYKTPTGIFTRAVQPSRRAAALGDGLSVEVTRGCGEAPGRWRRLVAWIDAAVNAGLPGE